jgi:hypothetical protein
MKGLKVGSHIIIVGSGRSGTSSVARVCHEELGICAGHFLKPGDDFNPKGYYEDLVSHAIIRVMVMGDNAAYSPKLYLELMNKFHSNCYNWCIKDPWFLYLPKDKLIELKPRLCIIAIRDFDGIMKSWIKLWRKNNKSTSATPVPKQVIDHYSKLTQERQQRANILRDIWPNVVAIDFTEHVPDEEIKSAIRYGISSASHRK